MGPRRHPSWPCSARSCSASTRSAAATADGLSRAVRATSAPQSERSWDLFAAERYRRGETDIPSYQEYSVGAQEGVGADDLQLREDPDALLAEQARAPDAALRDVEA